MKQPSLPLRAAAKIPNPLTPATPTSSKLLQSCTIVMTGGFTCWVGRGESVLAADDSSVSTLEGFAPHRATCLRSCLKKSNDLFFDEWIEQRNERQKCVRKFFLSASTKMARYIKVSRFHLRGTNGTAHRQFHSCFQAKGQNRSCFVLRRC